MDNLLSEIQNEISTIGFDKLKEIHFGAECSSGSESGENDVLDDEYYKNQPPAHSYDSIKDHVVKVNHRPRIQQIRKPYNRTNEFRKRGEPRRNWTTGRSGSNADHALQRESPVHLGYHRPPAPIKERGSSSSSSSNHISNWIIGSSIHQKALEPVIGGTPQRTFPIHSQVFNRSYFIIEARRFSDMINKNTLSPTSVPSSRAFSPSSNAEKQVLYNVEKPSGFYNHNTHFSNEKVSEANSIRNSSQSGGFAENEIVQNSYLLNNLAKMIDMKWSSPAPSSIKQQILIVDQILSTYRQRGMDSNNVTQSNPNTQIPSEQCHTSGDNHFIRKKFTDGLFSDQKEQERVKDAATSNLSKNINAATLASDNVCKKAAEDIVQGATKSPTSTTKAASDHVCRKTAKDVVQEETKSPTSTTKAASDHVCKKTAEAIVPEATKSSTYTTKAASDHVCKKTAEVLVQEETKSSTSTTKAGSDDDCKKTAEDVVQEATKSSTSPTKAASNDACKKTAEYIVQEAKKSSTSITKAGSYDVCKKTAEDIVQEAKKSSASITKAGSYDVCKKTAEYIVQEAKKSSTSITKPGSYDVCKKTAEDIVQEATRSPTTTTKAASDHVCKKTAKDVVQEKIKSSTSTTKAGSDDDCKKTAEDVVQDATKSSTSTTKAASNDACKKAAEDIVQEATKSSTSTTKAGSDEVCKKTTEDIAQEATTATTKAASDDVCKKTAEDIVQKATKSSTSTAKAASDHVCKKTAEDIVQEATKSSASTTKARGHAGNNSCSEATSPQPTYPTFTDNSEAVGSSVGRQATQTSRGVQSNIHGGTNTQWQLPSEQCQESGGNCPIIKIFTDCLFFDQKEQKPVKNVTTSNSSESRKAAMLASDDVCKKTAKDIVQETTRSSTSTTETTAPQPTYPTFTDKSEVVRSSVGRQASQNSKGVQSNVHEGAITGQPLPIDTREEFLRYIEKMYPREVRTIGCREFRRETIPVGSEDKCEEPEKAPTNNNESAQAGIVSWFCRILWK